MIFTVNQFNVFIVYVTVLACLMSVWPVHWFASAAGEYCEEGVTLILDFSMSAGKADCVMKKKLNSAQWVESIKHV